jgi:hypothetical protein
MIFEHGLQGVLMCLTLFSRDDMMPTAEVSPYV